MTTRTQRARAAGSLLVAALVFFAASAASLSSPGVVRAQPDDVNVVMIADTDGPTVGEPFQVQVEVRQTSGAPGLLEEPSFGSLRVTGTTGVRRMQSFQQVFGAPPQVEIRTVVGYSVVADQPGNYTIAPAVYRMGRRNVASAPLVIKVTGSAAAPASPTATGTAAAVGTFDPQVFLRATVDRTDPYVGQQVTYTLYLYSRANGGINMTRQPGTANFWVQDLVPSGRRLDPEVQVVQGQRYEVHVVRRLALFPTRSGDLEIGGAAISMDSTNAFDLFQGNRRVLERECPALHVVARALPANAPAGTIVGRATMDAALDRTNTQTGQAVALTVTLRGDGLLRDAAVTPPSVDGLRFEAPGVDDRVDTPNDIVGGERRFTWQVVPLRAGTFTIPALGVSVFDPNTGRLESVASPALVLGATGDAVPDDTEPDATETEDDATAAGDSGAIRFGPAHRHAEMRRRALPFHARPWFAPVLIAAPVVAALAWLARALAALTRVVRARVGARSSPKKHEKLARSAMAKGDSARFYAAIAAMLHQALDEALGERTTGMTHSTLRAALARDGDDLGERVVDELDAADFARFSAAGSSADEMRRTFERTTALVTRLGTPASARTREVRR